MCIQSQLCSTCNILWFTDNLSTSHHNILWIQIIICIWQTGYHQRDELKCWWEIDTWKPLLPESCSLGSSQKKWLCSRQGEDERSHWSSKKFEFIFYYIIFSPNLKRIGGDFVKFNLIPWPHSCQWWTVQCKFLLSFLLISSLSLPRKLADFLIQSQIITVATICLALLSVAAIFSECQACKVTVIFIS